MGKTQSKRSVDITTDLKKSVEEITEKVEKIEDTDHEDVSAAVKEIQEPNHLKKDSSSENNDKEVLMENNVVDPQGSGDNTVNQSKSDEVAASIANKENDSVNGDDTLAVGQEASKKGKKEKVKKKWSFRNISFGRKDKQKPSKTDEGEDNSPTGTSNGNNADGKSLNQQKESNGVEQLNKVEEDSEKPIGNYDADADVNAEKKSEVDKVSTINTPSQTENKLPDEQIQQESSENKDNELQHSTNGAETDNDTNVPNDMICQTETKIDTTEKTEHHIQAQAQNSPNSNECNAAVKNTSCMNGFTENLSTEEVNHSDTATNMNDDDIKDINNKSIPSQNKCESTILNTDNAIYELNSEKIEPQLEVIPVASAITANVDNLSIACNLSKQSQYSQLEDQNNYKTLQSNDDALLDSNYDTDSENIEAVVEHKKVDNDIKNDEDKVNATSLPPPPPIPTSPPPQLALSNYSIDRNVELTDTNNQDNISMQNSMTITIVEESLLNKPDNKKDEEANDTMPSVDDHQDNGDDQIFTSFNGGPHNEEKFDIKQNNQETEETAIKNIECDDTNETCYTEDQSVPSVNNHLILDKPIDMLNQSNENITNDPITNINDNKATIMTRDIDIEKSTTEIMNLSNNDSTIQMNGIENEKEDEEQKLVEQFEKKMLLITKAENEDTGNLIESL